MTVFRPLSLGLLASSLALLSHASLAQGSTGSQFRVTSKMEMPGMPIAMPPHVSEVCGPKNASAKAMVPTQGDCRIDNYRVTGNKSSFDMRCTGPGAMSGRGELELLGPEHYRGKMQVTVEGQSMVMTIEGQRIGDCNYTE